MKKVLILAFIAITAVQSFAIGLGVRGVFFVGSMTGDMDEYVGSGEILSFETLIPINEYLSVHPALGVEAAEHVNDKTEGFFSTTNEYHLSYFDLSIPVMARFNFTPNIFAEAGLNFGINLYTEAWSKVGSEETDHKSVDDAGVFNVDFAFGGGYIFDFGLFLDLRISYGLTNSVENFVDFTVDNQVVSKSGGRYAVQFGVGYWFKLR